MAERKPSKPIRPAPHPPSRANAPRRLESNAVLKKVKEKIRLYRKK